MTTLTLTIDFGNDREGAERAYAHLVGVYPEQLSNRGEGYAFSGAAVPSLFTLLRPASVRVETEEDA